MPFTRKALALVWLFVLGLFVLSASGILVGRNVLWLVLGALATPPIILTLAAKRRRSAATTAPFAARGRGPAARFSSL